MHVSRKPPLLYALFVGTPLILLTGVLLLGRHLEASDAVGGEWKVEPANPPRPDCDAIPSSGQPPSMRIAQHGSHVAVRLGSDDRGELRGAIAGNTFEAAPHRSGSHVIAMRAEIDPQPGHPSMTGTLRVANCPDVPFHASRNRPGEK